jgi:hypothetical protein
LPLGKANLNLAQGNLSMVHGVTNVWHRWIQKPTTMLCFQPILFQWCLTTTSSSPCTQKEQKGVHTFTPQSTGTNTTPYSASPTNCMVTIHVPILQVLTLEVLYGVLQCTTFGQFLATNCLFCYSGIVSMSGPNGSNWASMSKSVRNGRCACALEESLNFVLICWSYAHNHLSLGLGHCLAFFNLMNFLMNFC